MLQGSYLDYLLYFYFGMQLGIDLCEVINIHEQPCQKKTHLKYIA